VLIADEAQQLVAPATAALGNAVTDIGAVETADEHPRPFQVEAAQNLLPGGLVGGGGKRDARYVGKTLMEHIEADVFGAEIVPPLGHAMGLVDGEQVDAHPRQQVQHELLHQPFRCQIKQV